MPRLHEAIRPREVSEQTPLRADDASKFVSPLTPSVERLKRTFGRVLPEVVGLA